MMQPSSLWRKAIRQAARCTLALIVLAACGGGEETSPQLAAPPTRTPQPPTATPSIADEVAEVNIVPLDGYVTNFLDMSANVSALDRTQVFEEQVLNKVPECTRATYYPEMQPLELINLDFVSLDLDTWRASVESLPGDALVATIRDTLAQAFTLLPPVDPLTVCILPTPPPRSRDPQGQQEDQPLQDGGLSVTPLSSSLLVVTCNGGDACLDAVPRLVATNYHIAYQIGQEGLTYDKVPLLSFMLYTTRAADFVHLLYPDAPPDPWANALPPDQEATLWDAMQPYLDVTYTDRATNQKIERYLYGRDNSPDYPLWGGLFIGSQIVRAYRASHPAVTVPELASLSPSVVLQNSGYAPGQP